MKCFHQIEIMTFLFIGKDLQKKCLAIISPVTPAKLCSCILIIFILVALNVVTLSALVAGELPVLQTVPCSLHIHIVNKYLLSSICARVCEMFEVYQ